MSDAHAQFDRGAEIGKGAYGSVRAVFDDSMQQVVAIKRIPGLRELHRFELCNTLREVLILKHLKGQKHVVELHRAASDRDSWSSFDSVYLVMECAHIDLRNAITSELVGQRWPARELAFGVMSGLDCIHAAGIIHRDLKPSNILITLEGVPKLCDFGMSMGPSTATTMRHYVVTRWYRPPELLLRQQVHDCGVDLWSVGCILVEMFTRRILFKGNNSNDQRERVLDFLRKSTYQRQQLLLATTAPPDCVDLVIKLLRYNACNRLAARAALNHPLFDSAQRSASSAPLQPFTYVTQNANSYTYEALFQQLFAELSADMTPPSVFLAGTCDRSTWRQDIAIPILATARVSFYNPQLPPGEWTPEHLRLETKAKRDAACCLLVITDETSSIVTMLEAVEMITASHNVVLHVQDYPAAEDVNRGRQYLKHVAEMHGCPLFTCIEDACREAVRRVKQHE